MGGDVVCFNCGLPTDFVSELYGPICRSCLDARKPEVAPAEEPKPNRTTKSRGARAKAR